MDILKVYDVVTVNIWIFVYRTKESDGAAFDHQSLSLIKLNNSTILYLREVNRFLALVCILREDHFARQGMNFDF